MTDGQHCLEWNSYPGAGGVAERRQWGRLLGAIKNSGLIQCPHEPGVVNPPPLSLSSSRGEAGNLSSKRT